MHISMCVCAHTHFLFLYLVYKPNPKSLSMLFWSKIASLGDSGDPYDFLKFYR